MYTPQWPENDHQDVSDAGLIANRIADLLGVNHEHSITVVDTLLTVHARTPLDLDGMSMADDILLFADMQEMSRNLDRETGILMNGFVSRFAM